MELISSSLDGTIKFWNRRTFENEIEITNNNCSAIHSISFHKNLNLLASGSDDGIINLYEI